MVSKCALKRYIDSRIRAYLHQDGLLDAINSLKTAMNRVLDFTAKCQEKEQRLKYEGNVGNEPIIKYYNRVAAYSRINVARPLGMAIKSIKQNNLKDARDYIKGAMYHLKYDGFSMDFASKIMPTVLNAYNSLS